MNTQESVAAEVRAWLARRRLSARQAAMRLGWSGPYLSRRLLGGVPFDVSDLDAIAGLLDLPITIFFETPEGVQSGRIVRKSAFPAAIGLAAAA